MSSWDIGFYEPVHELDEARRKLRKTDHDRRQSLLPGAARGGGMPRGGGTDWTAAATAGGQICHTAGSLHPADAGKQEDDGKMSYGKGGALAPSSPKPIENLPGVPATQSGAGDKRQCCTCGAYLGGGVCADNLELECADGGHKLWRPCKRFTDIETAKAYVHAVGHRGGFRIRREVESYILMLDGWEDAKQDAYI